MSFWPFRTSGRVKDMSAQQVAEATMKAFHQAGRSTQAMRLLYRTLELDPFHAQGLLVLSELYRHGQKKVAKPVGDEALAGIIIEYAMDPKSTVPAQHKRLFDKARLDVMTAWGFATPRGTEVDIDHLGYMGYINELMSTVRSVGNGFRIALAKLGIQAGVLDGAKGVPTKMYEEWLNSDAANLYRF